MTDTKIRINVERTPAAGKDVPISEFVKIINAVRKLLSCAAATLGKNHKCDFVISNLSHSSPACVEITPQSSHQNSGASIIGVLMKQPTLSDKQNPLDKFYKEILNQHKNRGIWTEIEAVSGSDRPIPIFNTAQAINALKEQKLPPTIIELYAKKRTGHTSVTGMLDELNIHTKGGEYIKIYPSIPEWDAISVFFEPAFKEEIMKYMGKTVEVSGKGYYRRGSFRPHKMDMTHIKKYVSPSIKLAQMRNNLPNVVDDRTVQEHIDDIRDEWA